MSHTVWTNSKIFQRPFKNFLRMTIVIDYINKATYIDVESTQVPLSSHDIMIYFCKQTYQNLSESVHSERPENRVGLPLP